MNRAQVLGAARHVLTVVAGALVARGKLDESSSEVVVGAVISLATILWSVLSPEKKS